MFTFIFFNSWDQFFKLNNVTPSDLWYDDEPQCALTARLFPVLHDSASVADCLWLQPSLCLIQICESHLIRPAMLLSPFVIWQGAPVPSPESRNGGKVIGYRGSKSLIVWTCIRWFVALMWLLMNIILTWIVAVYLATGYILWNWVRQNSRYTAKTRGTLCIMMH